MSQVVEIYYHEKDSENEVHHSYRPMDKFDGAEDLYDLWIDNQDRNYEARIVSHPFAIYHYEDNNLYKQKIVDDIAKDTKEAREILKDLCLDNPSIIYHIG